MPKCSTFRNITCWHRSPIDGEIFPTRSKAVLCFSGGKSWGQILITPQAFGSSLLRLEIPTNHVKTHKQDEKEMRVGEVYEVFSTNNCFECVLLFSISYIAYLVLCHIKNTHRNILETKLIMFITPKQDYWGTVPRDPSWVWNNLAVASQTILLLFCLTVNITTFDSA